MRLLGGKLKSRFTAALINSCMKAGSAYARLSSRLPRFTRADRDLQPDTLVTPSLLSHLPQKAAYSNQPIVPFIQFNMPAENGSSLPVQDPSKVAEAPIETKGKGKSAATEEPVDQTMDEDDDSSDDDVSCAFTYVIPIFAA